MNAIDYTPRHRQTPRRRVTGYTVAAILSRNGAAVTEQAEPRHMAWADCPRCGESCSVGPPAAVPALTGNPGASDETELYPAHDRSTCEACGAVLVGEP